MPIPGLLAGLEEGFASETAKLRQANREREDREFTQQLQLLEQLRQDPRTTPELYQKVMQDTLKLQKGLASPRKPKSSIGGFLGQTETGQYHSQLLDQLASGQMPLFQDKQAFDTARQGTSQDFHQAVGQAVAGGAAAPGGAQPAGAVPPPPSPQPPQAGADTGAIPPLGDATSYVGAFHPRPDTGGGGPISSQVNSATPPMAGAPAGPAEGAPPAGGAPPGPVPSPPGTGRMTGAATDLSTQVARSGPVLPQPPTSADIMRRHAASPSAFFAPEELAQMQASAGAEGVPYQVRAERDALIAAGMDPRMATLAAARKLTGFAGNVQSSEGPWYQGPDGVPFRSVLQKDPYGNFVHVHPTTGEPLGNNFRQVDPAANQIVTDPTGQLRVVSKIGGPASGVIQDPTGQTRLGKPYTPPPMFQSVQVVAGPNGEPQMVGIPRGGGAAVPLEVKGAPAAAGQGVPPPPGAGGRGVTPPRPATKFERPQPLSNEQQSALTGVFNIKQASERALEIIDQMEQQGANMDSPIGQSIDLWLVQHGWNPGELQEQLFQNVGYQEVNAMRAAGIGGRPNMRMIEIFQNHVGQPGSSLSLLRTQLQGLEGIVDKAASNILTVSGMYRQLPYKIPGVAQQPGQTSVDTGQGVTPPPPPKWSNSPRK